MTEKDESPKIGMTNTKKEMLEAYRTIKSRHQTQEKQILDAEKARKKLEIKLSEATADSQASQAPLERLFNLRSDFSRKLTDLAEKFELEIDTYTKIKTAVEEKQKGLAELYEIETAASDLAALIEAQQETKDSFKEEVETRKDLFEEEMKRSRAKWKQEEEGRKQAADEKKAANEKSRRREKEEYEYTFARTKEQRQNALDDELKKLGNEIAQKRGDFEQQLQLRKTELDDREKTIADQENELARLREDAEKYPQKLKQEKDAAVESTTERLTSDFEKNTALIKAQSEGEKNVLESKIESLEKLVKSQEEQMTKMAEQHEQAYEKVQDIANRAVAATKREFISVPVSPQREPEQQNERKSG